MMTPDEVVTAFNQNLNGDDQEITFWVYLPAAHGGMLTTKYCETLKRFDLSVKKSDTIEQLLEEQQTFRTSSWTNIVMVAPCAVLKDFNWMPQELTEVTIEDLVDISEDKVIEYMKYLPSLKEENMVEGQNAYIRIYGDHLEIFPEQMGNVLSFDDAVSYAKECLKNKNYDIDFRTLVTPPEIDRYNERLVNNVETINNCLSKVITVEFSNGDSVTLDSQRMIKWVEESKENEGEFVFNIDDNLPDFVSMIEDYVIVICREVTITAGDKQVTVDVKEGKRATIDKDETFNVIKQLIMSGGEEKEHVITPVYQGDYPLVGTLKTYIALSIEDQTVWAYDNGTQILEADCVTGNVRGGHSTPTGIYYLTYKTTDATLRGYNNDGSKYASFVNYWMPFNGGIGFHDASWRYGKFGGEIYKTNGSHGCVNMRLADAETLYNFINETIPIIVF